MFFPKPTVAMTNSSGDGRVGEWAIVFLQLSARACGANASSDAVGRIVGCPIPGALNPPDDFRYPARGRFGFVA